MQNKFILFLCFYLASAVLALGLTLPSYNSARQATKNDTAAYEKDKMLQIKHDAWLQSDEAKQQEEEYQREYDNEIKRQHSLYEPTTSSTGLPSLYDLTGANITISDFEFSQMFEPQDVYHDALAWNRAGGYPPFNWQWDDQLRLSIDKGGLIRYENILYIYALASIAYWIIAVGLFLFLNKQDTLRT